MKTKKGILSLFAASLFFGLGAPLNAQNQSAPPAGTTAPALNPLKVAVLH